MAVLSANYITLADIAKRSNSDGGIADIVEMLAQMSPVARMGYAEQCNDGSSHRTTLRMSIPSPTWVQYYSRITPTKSTTKQVVDATGMMENFSEIDERLYNRTKDKAKLRLSEASAILEGFAQEIEQTFFYGNTGTSPLEFLGLAPRMNSSTAENGRQVVNAGGTGSDNTSMFICTWGPNTGHLLYPELSAGGGVAGIQREDLGTETSETSNGIMRVVREKFSLHTGFTMRDWRYFVRVANIDVSNLTTGSAADLIDLLISAYYRLPSRRSTTGFSSEGAPIKITPVIYCNATIMEALDKQARLQPNRYLVTMEDSFGQEVLSFRGMPIY